MSTMGHFASVLLAGTTAGMDATCKQELGYNW